jgi:hypothetical protein
MPPEKRRARAKLRLRQRRLLLAQAELRREHQVHRPVRLQVRRVEAEVGQLDLLARPERRVRPQLPLVVHLAAVAADSVDFVQTLSMR